MCLFEVYTVIYGPRMVVSHLRGDYTFNLAKMSTFEFRFDFGVKFFPKPRNVRVRNLSSMRWRASAQRPLECMSE